MTEIRERSGVETALARASKTRKLINRIKRETLKGRRVEAICLPEQSILYASIPKIACTTLKQALFEIKYKCTFDKEQLGYDVHQFFRYFDSLFLTPSQIDRLSRNYYSFTVVRDPVKRFLSCYSDRIVLRKDLETEPGTADRLQRSGLPLNPDLNTFALNLTSYMRANKSIAWHARPLSSMLQGDLSVYTEVYDISETPQVNSKLCALSQMHIGFGQFKSQGRKHKIEEMSPEALRHIRDFYKNDILLLQKEGRRRRKNFVTVTPE